MNSGSKVRYAVFASASDIYRNGGIGRKKFEGRGVRTQIEGEKRHCAIVVPNFFKPHREVLARRKVSFLRLIRDEAALEPEHISRIVVHGSLSDIQMIWNLGNVPDGVSWVVNQNGDLKDAINTVSRQQGGELYVVMPKSAPLALGHMIANWQEEGEIVIPSNRQMAKMYPGDQARSSLRPLVQSRR